jgi:NAD-dependent SIR2 family protein deacetylase
VGDKIVFVLGAGASRSAGAPLMKDFLHRADDVSASRFLPENEKSAFDLVRRGRVALQAVHSKADYDIRNLESVFAAFEMATRFGQLGPLDDADVARLPQAMRQAIVRTLERTMMFPVRHEDEGFLPHDDYRLFGELVSDLKGRGSHHVSVLTFNYDIGADVGLHRAKCSTDYCIEGPRAMNWSTVPLLKLHGSINWRYCAQCASGVEPWPVVDLLRRFKPMACEVLANEKREGHIAVSEGLAELHPRCEHTPSLPFIVPPTLNKSNETVAAIGNVWKSAAQALRASDTIIVIGYSWPRSDQFFQSLYALGTAGDALLKRFWVFDPNPAVKRRFQALVRGHAADPDCFHFFEPTEVVWTVPSAEPEATFASAIATIRKELVPPKPKQR